jgi:hypothetical protein
MFFNYYLSFFLESVSCFSHEWLKISLIQQFKQISYIYNYTFDVLKIWLKKFLTFWLGVVEQFLRRFFKVLLEKS